MDESVKVMGWTAISPHRRVIGATIRPSENECINALLKHVDAGWGALLERGWSVSRIQMEITVVGDRPATPKD